MSARWWKAPETAFLDRRLQTMRPALFRLWFNLNCIASWSGGRLPVLADVAFLLRCSPAALARHLEALEDAGLLTLRGGEVYLHTAAAGAPDGDDAGKDRPSPMTAAERTRRWRERQAQADGDARPCDAPVTSHVTARDVTVTPIEKEIEKKETDSPRVTRAACDDLFSRFWSAFPSRDGDNPRGPAADAWRKAIDAGADAEQLISAAKRYAAATKDRERRYVCSAVRWLSEGRWQGESKPAAAPIDSGVWISRDAPEWAAWEAHWRRTQGKTPPIDSKGGWRFPTKTPPVDEDPAIMTANGHPWPRSKIVDMVEKWKENPMKWPPGWWPPDHWDCMFPRWLLEELGVKMVSTLEAAE